MKTLMFVLIAGAMGLSVAVADDAALPLDDSTKEVVKITDQGLVPPVLTFSKLDGSVFFVNATADSLVTVKVDFGAHAAHCASPNLKLDSGVMRSTSPIGPRDFALMCFPSAGTYAVTVEGVGKRPALTGTVIVQ